MNSNELESGFGRCNVQMSGKESEECESRVPEPMPEPCWRCPLMQSMGWQCIAISNICYQITMISWRLDAPAAQTSCHVPCALAGPHPSRLTDRPFAAVKTRSNANSHSKLSGKDVRARRANVTATTGIRTEPVRCQLSPLITTRLMRYHLVKGGDFLAASLQHPFCSPSLMGTAWR